MTRVAQLIVGVVVAVSVAQPIRAQGVMSGIDELIFVDSFETGDTCRWEPDNPGHCILPGKKGIAKGCNLPHQGQQIEMLDVYWNYRWGTFPCTYLPDGVLHVPMVKCGSDPASFQNWITNNVIPMALSGRYTLLLPFNEPDNQHQCDGIMTVDEAVALWPMLEEVPLPLASPATAGDDWLDEFMLEVERLNLRVDFIAYHWYGRPEWWRPMNKLTRVHDEHQLPMIITELAPAWWGPHSYTPQQACWFAKNVLPWLEEQEWIAGYAWFPFHPDNPAGGFSALFETDTGTTLTPLGEFYASVTNENPQGDQSISCE